jgi:hypothetical protein
MPAAAFMHMKVLGVLVPLSMDLVSRLEGRKSVRTYFSIEVYES